MIILEKSDITMREYYTLRYVSALQMELLSKIFLIRGGIAYGKIYHGNNMVYGPGLIEAYNIEQEVENPFIGISDSFDLSDLRDNIKEVDGKHGKVKIIDFLSFCNLNWFGSFDDGTRGEIDEISNNLSNNRKMHEQNLEKLNKNTKEYDDQKKIIKKYNH